MSSKPSESTPFSNHLSRRRVIRSILAGGVLAAAAGTYSVRRPWNTIVIHHSAGEYGNVAFLKKVHQQRQKGDPVDSMAYHFVVGNGKGMPMGAVDWGLRWRWRLWGAHVSGRNHRANLFGIGICMIGNFEKHNVPEPQYKGLFTLCRQLMGRFNIPLENITLHRALAGEQTLCPGRYFPFQQLKQDLLLRKT